MSLWDRIFNKKNLTDPLFYMQVVGLFLPAARKAIEDARQIITDPEADNSLAIPMLLETNEQLLGVVAAQDSAIKTLRKEMDLIKRRYDLK